MKQGKIARLLKRLFKLRTKDHVQVYLSRFETVDKFVRSNLIGIDFKDAYVSIDVSVHLLYMNDIRKYESFFDVLRAYINYHRGEYDIPMLEFDERINFCVSLRHEIRFDLEKEEFYEKPKIEYIPCVIGYYQSGNLTSAPYKPVKD